MLGAPIIKMKVDKEVRVSRLVNEYGDSNPEEFIDAMGKIYKRLGGQHYLAAKEKLLQGDMHATISILLDHYYDKAYERSAEKKYDLIKGVLPWDGKDAVTYAQSLIDQVNNLKLV